MNKFGTKYLALACSAMIVLTGCGGNTPSGSTEVSSDTTQSQQTVAEETVDTQTPEEAKADVETPAENNQAKPAEDQTQQEEKTEAEVRAEEEAEKDVVEIKDLPPYEHPDTKSANYAVDKYLIEIVGKQYDKTDVCIPLIRRVALDESNPDDVRFYGIFWIDNFDINGTILESKSGGSYPGVMHLKKTETGYEVTSFDVCEDGSAFDESAKKLFGDNYEVFSKIYADDSSMQFERTQNIVNYVLFNNLPITGYQDYDSDPIIIR